MPFYPNGSKPNLALVLKQNEIEKAYWERHPGIYSAAVAPPPRADGVRYPDFFVLGAQKGGTTWLMNQLAFHPQVWCPIVKEIFYFDEFYSRTDASWAREARVNQLNSTLATSHVLPHSKAYIDFANAFYAEAGPVDDRWYSCNFERGGADQFVGDAVITFPILPLVAVGHMRRLSPHAKCIFLVRDPFERVWSHMRMLLAAEDRSPEAQLGVITNRRNLLRTMTDYSVIYRRVLAGFPKEQTLVLDYSEIGRAPAQILRSVCEFIGVAFDDDLFPYKESVVFKGPDATRDPRIVEAIAELTAPIYASCKDVFPDIAAQWSPPAI